MRWVVLDAVGTVIYPDPAVAAVYTAVGRRFGSRLSEAEVGQRFRAVFADVEGQRRAAGPETSEAAERSFWRRVVSRVLHDLEEPEPCFAELFEHFARPDAWRLFPDVAGSLQSLAAAGMRLALASNFDRRLLGIARSLGPLQRCDPVLVSSEIGFRKPHRQFFEVVLARLASRPEQVVWVGDDPDNDVAAARSCGMQALLLRRTGAECPGAIRSLAELPQRLAALRNIADP